MKSRNYILIVVLILSVVTFFQQGLKQLVKGRFVQTKEVRVSNLVKVEGPEKPQDNSLDVESETITAKPKPERVGLIKSIVYGKNAQSTMISGTKSILYEENIIHGATILKIHKDKVEFAKNGRTWIQKVGEAPDPEWHRKTAAVPDGVDVKEIMN